MPRWCWRTAWSASSDYRLDLSKDTQLLLDKAALKLADFSINSPQGKPLAKLASLDVAATTLDLAKQEVVLGEVRSQGLEAWAAREKDGQLDWQKLFADFTPPPRKAPAPAGGKHRSRRYPDRRGEDHPRTGNRRCRQGSRDSLGRRGQGQVGGEGRQRRRDGKGNGRQRVRQGRGRHCRQGSQARDEQGSEDRQGNRAGNGQDCGDRQGGQRLSATARRHCKDASAGKYESRRGDACQALAHRPARRPVARLQGASGGSPAGHRGPAGSRPAGPRPAERRQPRQDPFDLKLKTGLGNRGQVQASGQVVLDPVSARLKVSTRDIDLRVAQAYISPFIRLELRSGFLGSELAVDLKSVEPLAFSVDGSAEVSQLHTLDTIKDRDFVKWTKLTLNGLAYRHEDSLSIQSVSFEEPYARFIINEDRSTNVSELIIPQPASSSGKTAAESKNAPASKPLGIHIGGVRINNGSANFADLTLMPPFGTAIQQLSGEVGTLDTRNSQPAKVDIKGKVDKYAPVTIAGELDPFDPLKKLDITTSFKRVELTTLTPYSGKFAGYRIRKGRLNLTCTTRSNVAN